MNTTYPHLPSEILLQIFQFIYHPQDLYRCALQSRAWSYCALQLLWQRPVIVKVETWMKIANVLSKRETYIDYSAAIQRINLSAIADYINDDSLAVLSICEHLDRVTLAGCDSITDNGLSYFCKHAGRFLSCIDLSEMTEITDRSLFTIANACPHLQGLNISLSKEPNQETVTDKSILQIAQRCKKLKRIRFTNRKAITDRAIQALTLSCPSIIELDVTHCSITNDGLKEILNGLGELRELKVNHCIHLNDHGFLYSSVSDYHQLRLLDLSGVAQITDRTVDWITRAAPKLRSLVLNKCEHLTDQSVQSIARLGKHLHLIHLGSCKLITDDAVLTLVKHCSRIRYVDLTSCTLITDHAVAALATLSRLKRIGLVRCELITDRAMIALAHTHSTLERVHLSHCRHLTVKALSRLVLRCKQLNHLSLSFIPAFQLSEFQQFSREPPKDYLADTRSFLVISGFDIHKLRACLRTIKYADMVLYSTTTTTTTPYPTETSLRAS
ncbi:hypothetical protein BY458DRAFT_559863 [Sporodiniella umbellata]|nr:hypothetical protein BY458DRAFT_559863 [Sporodiniella umbellata]